MDPLKDTNQDIPTTKNNINTMSTIRASGDGTFVSDQNEILLSWNQNQNINFLKMKLNKGISKLNVISFLTLSFVNFTALIFTVGFISFILRDPKYYDIKEDQVGPIASALGF